MDFQLGGAHTRADRRQRSGWGSLAPCLVAAESFRVRPVDHHPRPDSHRPGHEEHQPRPAGERRRLDERCGYGERRARRAPGALACDTRRRGVPLHCGAEKRQLTAR